MCPASKSTDLLLMSVLSMEGMWSFVLFSVVANPAASNAEFPNTRQSLMQIVHIIWSSCFVDHQGLRSCSVYTLVCHQVTVEGRQDETRPQSFLSRAVSIHLFRTICPIVDPDPMLLLVYHDVIASRLAGDRDTWPHLTSESPRCLWRPRPPHASF